MAQSTGTWRRTVAVIALVLVGCLALLTLRRAELRCSAVVDSSSTFCIESISPGRLQCSLRDGRAPGGRSLLSERVLTFERNDMMELVLDERIGTGVTVAEGQVLATVRSMGNLHRLAGLEAQRSALQAQRALLVAGGAPEEVAEAEQAVDLAEAERVAGQAELHRIRLLAEQGLASAGELEIAELEDQVDQARVALARAGVEVAAGQVRPETLAEIDARLTAAEAAIEELGILQRHEVIRSPIAGMVQIPADGSGLLVHRLEPAYIEIAIPTADRSAIEVDTEVLFSAVEVPRSLRGRITEISTRASLVRGAPVYWASARIDDPGVELIPGMAGTAFLSIAGEGFGPLAAFRQMFGRP